MYLPVLTLYDNFNYLLTFCSIVAYPYLRSTFELMGIYSFSILGENLLTFSTVDIEQGNRTFSLIR